MEWGRRMAIKGDYGSMTVREFGDAAHEAGMLAADLIELSEPLLVASSPAG